MQIVPTGSIKYTTIIKKIRNIKLNIRLELKELIRWIECVNSFKWTCVAAKVETELSTGSLRSLNTSLSLLLSHVTHLQLLCLSYHNWRNND